MSGYTIFAPIQSPSTVPTIVGNTLSPLANYVNRNTPYWLREGSAVVNTSALIINNADNSITNITSFNPNDSFSTAMVDLSGAGDSTTLITWTPQGTRPYAQWDATFPGDVFAANLLNTITNFTTLSFTFGTSPYPTSPAAGRILTETFTVPKTGVYLLQSNLSLNVNPEAVVVGASDFVVIGLIEPTGLPIIGASTTLKPFDMAGTGQDYAIQSSVQANLVATTQYCLMFYVYNVSTTLALGGSSGGGQLKITQLC